MIGIDPQRSEKELLADGGVTPAVWFYIYKYRIDFFECLRVGGFQYPTLLAGVIHIEDAKIQGLFLVGTAPAPSLERTRVLESRLLVQIVGVKNQRFALRIEDAPIRLIRFAGSRHIVDLYNVEVPRSHQIPNVPVMFQKLALVRNRRALLVNRPFSLVNLIRQIADLSLQRLSPPHHPQPLPSLRIK